MIKFFETYFIKSNIWVSICFTALLVFFQLGLYDIILSVWGIAFFGTLAIYNFSRIRSIQDLFLFQSEHKSQIILIFIGLIGTLICVVLRGFEIKTFLYLGVLGFVSFCYSLPFSGLGLRTIPFLKLFLIAFVWAGSSIGLLLVVHDDLFAYKFLFISVFLFVVGITIPFDIRDSNSDERQLKTIPQVIGVNYAKTLSILSLVSSSILFWLEFGEWNILVKSWMITILISIVFVIISSEKRNDFYYSFWIESCSLIPLVIYFLFQI